VFIFHRFRLRHAVILLMGISLLYELHYVCHCFAVLLSGAASMLADFPAIIVGMMYSVV